ncbi:cytochrome P450 3A29-like isoform X2 [Watersipora subatra]|uniref:cytochrome P450 3A29-like isoform X2 n=1 Tax=Watersipora subatra TaxID=2589382 RepID=UPI00355BB341
MLLGGFEIPLWVMLGVPAVTLLYMYSTRTFNIFKKAGIPGPKPYPLIGSSMVLYGDNIMNIDMKLRAKYGKFVGVFEGTTPVLMVYDGMWLKEAFIKNFNKFINRREFVFGGVIDEGLFSIGGEHWKFVRKMLSPEFSSGKLKRLMPAIQKCDDRFIEVLRKERGQPVDIRRKTNLLTLDVISRTAFGFDAETQTKEDNEFAKNAFALTAQTEANSTLLDKIRNTIILFVVLMAPPSVARFAYKTFNLGLVDANYSKYFYLLCENVIEARRNDSARGTDFLQTLADNFVDETKASPLIKDERGRKWTEKGLTKNEVIGNAILFLFAGFQTTADTMFFIFYELAMHPDVQEKLYEEIMSVCATEEVTTEQLNELKYLDRCIQETMRLYPQGFRFDREASEDVTIKDIFIKKGTAVTASGWAIHRDPEIWRDPEDFEPDRFLPEQMTEEMHASYMPFGMGNRQCIGNRLALIEMKMTIVATLKAFKIERNKETPFRPLKFKAVLALAPEKTVKVSFKERQ